jgi:hypothetical protein
MDKKEKCFAARIAGFTAVGMAFAVGVPTFVDPRLRTHRVFGARNYPMGYWILLMAPLIFFGMYYAYKIASSTKKKMVFPLLFLIIVGCLSFLNFFPEFPHQNVMCWLLLYFIGDVVSLWVYHQQLRTDYIHSTDILDDAKIELTKESINFWRTSTLSTGVGYLAIVIPWCTLTWTCVSTILTDPKEITLAGWACGAQLFPFSLFFLFCPIREGIRKWQDAIELFRQIKKPANSGSPAENK